MNADLYCGLDDGISNLGIESIVFLVDLSTSSLEVAKCMDDRKLGKGINTAVNQSQDYDLN